MLVSVVLFGTCSMYLYYTCTPLEKLKSEAKFSGFEQVECRHIYVASRSITILSDGLHKTFWKSLSPIPNCTTSAIANIISILKKFNILLPQNPVLSIEWKNSMKINSTKHICFSKMFRIH